MNILEPEQPHSLQVTSCKIAYFQQQNKWIADEYAFLDAIVAKYKQILKQADLPHLVQTTYQQINHTFQSRLQYYQQCLEAKLSTQSTFPLQTFLHMVYSFEGKIHKLKQQIRKRQGQLQQIQKDRNEQDNDQDNIWKEFDRDRDIDLKISMKSIMNYDICGKMVEKVVRQIAKMKEKKRKLNEIIAQSKCNRANETLVSACTDSNFKLNKKMYPEHTNSSDKENDGERALSIFEQIVLVLKKNMYHNEQLREKVRKAKLQLQQTDTVCKALAKKKEELEWANLGQCEYEQNGNHIGSASNTDQLSMLGQTLINTYEMSFDISRFLPPILPESHRVTN